MADLITFRRWNNSDTATKVSGLGSTAGYVTFKDEDGGIPGSFKRWYGVRMTYKAKGAVAKTTAINVAVDGGTLGTNGVPTGNLNYVSASAWAKDDVLFSTIKSVQSAQVKVVTDTSSGVFEINDVGLELRSIYRRVT
jgi:threonine dehydrogenase-like Zn-dependent dehydrogenase